MLIERSKITIVYSIFRHLINENKIQEIETLFALLDPKIDLSLALAVLTASAPIKDRLPGRTKFYKKIKWRWDVMFRPSIKK